MLNLVDNNHLDAALLEKGRELLEQIFFLIALKIVQTACKNNPLKKRSRAMALGSVDFNDGHVIARCFASRKKVRGEPIKVRGLPHTRLPTKEKIALLPKRAIFADSYELIIELANVGGHDKHEVA